MNDAVARPPAWRVWAVTLATLVGVVVTARLGLWQLDRAAQKEALQASVAERSQLPALGNDTLAATADDAAGQHARAVRLRGEWVGGATVFLENRQMHGQPGFFVVTPLKLDGRADAVLVQRGWAPRDLLDRHLVPKVESPAGTVEVVGRVAPPPSKMFDFAGTAVTGPLRQNIDVATFSVEAGVPLRPLAVVQTETPPGGDGLKRDWPAPAVDVSKHHGYAFQWFALCALMAGLHVWFQFIRPRIRRAR